MNIRLDRLENRRSGGVRDLKKLDGRRPPNPKGMSFEERPIDLDLASSFEPTSVVVQLFRLESLDLSEAHRRSGASGSRNAPRNALQKEAKCPEVHRVGVGQPGLLRVTEWLLAKDHAGNRVDRKRRRCLCRSYPVGVRELQEMESVIGRSAEVGSQLCKLRASFSVAAILDDYGCDDEVVGRPPRNAPISCLIYVDPVENRRAVSRRSS